MVFLPEAVDFIGQSKQETMEMAESLEGPTITSYRQLAAEQSIWISVGSFHQKVGYCYLNYQYSLLDTETLVEINQNLLNGD